MSQEALAVRHQDVLDTDPAEKWAPVRVARRLHQFSMVFGVFFAPVVTFNVADFLFSGNSSTVLEIVVLFLILIVSAVLPAYLVFKIFPPSDEARIMADGIVFRRLGKVPFSDIKSYNTDDYFKLVRYGRPTLMLHPPTKGDVSQYPRFREELLHALLRQTVGHGADTSIERKHFYGSTAAKFVGLFLVVVGGGAVIAMFLMSESIKGGLIIALAAVAAGVALMSGRRLGR